MVELRTGLFGEYYGSTVGTSEALNTGQMQVNAEYIYSYLIDKGWTTNAIAGMLGNLQAESSMNPGRWQNDDVGNTSGGYGLVQWTPATKYIDWCTEQNINDYSEMDSNLSRIIYEVENNLQWIKATNSDIPTFKDFTKSTKSISELATEFLLCYERPADQSEEVQAYRSSLSENWFSFLGGVPVITPTTKKKPKKYNFILFNKRRYTF